MAAIETTINGKQWWVVIWGEEGFISSTQAPSLRGSSDARLMIKEHPFLNWLPRTYRGLSPIAPFNLLVSAIDAANTMWT